MEPVRERGGAGAVVAGPAGLVAAGGGGGRHPGAGAAGVFAGPGHGQTGGQVRVRGRGAGRPGGDRDGGFQRPGEFAQRLAFVVFMLAVVALADVPAAVGVAGREAGALGRAAAEQRDGGGVQPGAAVEGSPLVAVKDGDASLQQRIDQRLEPVPGGGGLIGGHRPGAGLELVLGKPPVLRQRRGVRDLEDLGEAVAHPAVGGQERPLGGGGARDGEQPPGRGRQLAEQQPGGLGEEQRPVIQGQGQQRGQHRAHGQRPGPPGHVRQRGLDNRRGARPVDQRGGEGNRLIPRQRASPGDIHLIAPGGSCPRPAARPCPGRRRRAARSGPAIQPGGSR